MEVNIMKVISLSVGGFKNLDYTTLSLDGIAAIVSPNNYGKSNFLEALSFATDFISSGTKTRKQMMGWTKGIPITKNLDTRDFKFQVEFYDPNLGDYAYVRYGFSFSWFKDDQSGQRITNEWIDLHSVDSNRYTGYLKRQEGKYRKGNSTTAFRKLNFDDSQLAIDILSSVTDLEYANVIQAIQTFEYRICSSLDLQNRFQAPPIEVADNQCDTIKFDDEDVPRALFFLKKKCPEKYLLFKESIFTLFPEFIDFDVQAYEPKKGDIHLIATTGENFKEMDQEKIPFHVRDEMYRLVIQSSTLNQPINISMMSTGTKRLFWLLANVFISSCTNVSCIGIEELETSIHPKMLKNLLEILSEALEGTQLIISSHSPYLIQYLKSTQLFVGVPSTDGVAVFKKIAPSKAKHLISASRDYGMSFGEYLFELLSGDENSYNIIRKYLGGD